MSEPAVPADASAEPTRRDFLAIAAAGSAAVAVASVVPLQARGETPATAPATAPMAEMVAVALKVNGRECTAQVDPRASLLDTLREYLNLTGTKKGCDHGQCGACTVLLDGRRVDSCLVLAQSAAGSDVTNH